MKLLTNLIGLCLSVNNEQHIAMVKEHMKAVKEDNEHLRHQLKEQSNQRAENGFESSLETESESH